MAADENVTPVGELVDDDQDENLVRRPQHLKRGDPRAAAIEGHPVFRENPEEARPKQVRKPAAARGK